MFKNKSIGAKITVFLSGIVIVSMILISLLSYMQADSSLLSQMTASMQTNVKAEAAVVASKVAQYENDVQLTASRTRIQSLDWSQQQPVLKADSQSYGFESMAFTTTGGELTKYNNEKAEVTDREYFKQAMGGKTYISDPEISKTTGKLVIHIAVPVKNENGKVIGVVVGIMDGEFLSTLCKDMKCSASGYGYIVDAQGTTIGDGSDESHVTSKMNAITVAKKDSSMIPAADVIKKMIGGGTGIAQYTMNGVSKYVAYAPISGTTWSLAAVVPKSDIAAGSNKLLTNSLILMLIVMVIACLLSGVMINRSVTRPVKETLAMIDELAKGRLKRRIKVKSRDELGRMSAAMNSLAETLQKDIVGSLRQIAGGDMNIRITAKAKDDEITPVVLETAETVRAIVVEAGGIIEAVNDGVLDKRCAAGKYSGDWKTLAQKINDLCDSVAGPIEAVRGVIRNISVNDYTVKVHGAYKGAFKALADDADTVVDRLLGLQDIVIRVSNGDTSRLAEFSAIGKRSENDNILPAVITMMTVIEDLIREVNTLSAEAVNGNVMKARGNAGRFEGGYKEIVRGFNGTLDAVAAPLTEVEAVLGNMAVNDYTIQVTGDFKGEFKKLAQAVNDVQERLISAQDTAVRISNGDISTLESFRAVGKRSENDRLLPAFISMMEVVKALIEETTEIADSAANGNLSVRGDAEKFKGGYAEIVGAINRFLDAVERPTDQITELMEEIAQSRMGQTIDGAFQGQFKVLVDAVNTTSMHLKAVITRVAEVITRMAGGDFGLDTIEDYPGDMASISTALNYILNALNEVLTNVSETASQVAAGSAQVSQGSQMLSQGATEQASSVEELSASIDDIAGKTRQNAGSAGNASELVEKVLGNAVSGKGQMNEMVKAMAEISESSKNISKIIKVIDDIAFQTNILALNAAVEAARAGQAGKGFAVVADEVRNLAAKSASAAKDTTLLIEGTVTKVESGKAIANSTAKAFEDISDGIHNVAQLVSEIASASNDQATGISQVSGGLEQVSKVVQTNSATSEQSAAASEELSSQAALLNEQVAKFSLRGQRREKAAASRPAENAVTAPRPVKESETTQQAAAASIDLDAGSFGKY